MKCAACERNLSAYIDDELTTEMRLEIDGHLDECDTCRAEFESQQMAWEAANAVQSGRAPEGLWEAIETAVAPEGQATGLDDLALMIRGLAGEVQDLRREVQGLRRDMEAAEFGDEREAGEGRDEDIRSGRYLSVTARQREQQFRRSS